MSGENLPPVGKLLRHRRYRTTAGYAHLAEAHLVEVAEKVGTSISGSPQPFRSSVALPCVRRCASLGQQSLMAFERSYQEAA